jgi:molybdopterin-guanine dinucleotide biosynthesis protein A
MGGGEVKGASVVDLDIGCIVLAGGKGLRLGRDKAFEVVGSSNLFQRVVSQLSSFNSDIIVVIANGRSLSQFGGYPRVRIVTDIYPGKGALGGLHAGLAASDVFYNLVVACDMPFLNQALLQYMVRISPGFDLVVPRLGELVEPLHAVYSKDCLPPIERLLEQGETRLRPLFALVKVRYIEDDEISRFDPEHLSFFNVNTEADLKTAQRLAKEMSVDKR